MKQPMVEVVFSVARMRISKVDGVEVVQFPVDTRCFPFSDDCAVTGSAGWQRVALISACGLHQKAEA